MYQKYSNNQLIYILHENQQKVGKLITTPFHHEKLRKKKSLLEEIIRSIRTNGPAGLLHARILSAILKRPVRIWQDERLLQTLGNRNGKLPVDLSYTPTAPWGTGHWCLRGGKDPALLHVKPSPNDCLYEAVAAQTGINVVELRRRTARIVRRYVKAANAMVLAANTNQDGQLIGGARYSGSSPRDAGQLLDASQNGACHPEGRSGHPRGHASHQSAGRSEDSVETYSFSRWRSGFLSRDDQDLVCHYTLITSQARDMMDTLNRGSYKADAHIARHSLDYNSLPKAQIWSQGTPEGSPSDFQRVCLVGKHFLGQHNNEYADLFILTFYPII